MLDRLRAAASLAKPSLRVVGLTYTGLGGMLALALVVSVAVVPVGPALQQVAEPARQAVTSLVQPTSDAVTVFFGGGAPMVHVEGPAAVSSSSRAAAFSDVVSLDVTIEDAPAEPMIADEPVAAVVAPVVTRAPAAEAQTPADETVDETTGVEPIEVSAPHPVQPVVVVLPAPTVVLQMASQEAPKPLPTLVPPETAAQTKARLDVENQAAIDAAKAAQLKAKADADTANNAAIAALKAAATATAVANNAPVAEAATVVAKAIESTDSAVAAPVATTSAVTKAKTSDAPTPAPTVVVTPQSKAAANAANQAAIDAAKAAQAKARVQANAANQAAQAAAAKGAGGPVKAMPTPAAQPTPAAAQPAAQPSAVSAATSAEVAGVTAESLAGANADGADAQGNVSDTDTQAATVLENAPIDQASTLSADSAA